MSSAATGETRRSERAPSNRHDSRGRSRGGRGRGRGQDSGRHYAGRGRHNPGSRNRSRDRADHDGEGEPRSAMGRGERKRQFENGGRHSNKSAAASRHALDASSNRSSGSDHDHNSEGERVNQKKRYRAPSRRSESESKASSRERNDYKSSQGMIDVTSSPDESSQQSQSHAASITKDEESSSHSAEDKTSPENGASHDIVFSGLAYEVDDSDSFPYILQCRVPDETCSPESVKILWWFSPARYVSADVEESMIDTLVRWGQKERGTMKSQPPFRLQQIRQMCNRKGVQLIQALSLRRHHIKNYNPYCSMTRLGLGPEEDIRESARLFEVAIQEHLEKNGIEFWTEEEQKHHFEQQRKERGDYPSPPTPDFVFKEEVRVKKYAGKHKGERRVLEERPVRWIDAKMFYGASTIEQGSKSAVGSLLATATKYNNVHGPGAMVFMYGCGDRLAAILAEAGVMVLDCSDRSISLDAVQAHQRTWCGDEHGNILP